MKDALGNRVDVQTIEFTSIEYVMSSAEISPFSQISEDDIVVLNQCMRPEVRTKIEAELGVSTREIPFRSLIHMFRFLSEIQGEQYERLKNVLSAHELIADKIVTAFFAVSEDTKYGEVLLSLSEKLSTEDLEKVLSKYNDLASTSFMVSMDMLASVEKDSLHNELNNEKLSQALSKAQLGLLKRARLILEQINTSTQIEDIGIYLSDIKDDVILFGSMVRSLRGTGVTFEQIQGVHIESYAGDELTDVQRQQLIDIFTSVREHGSDPEVLQTESLRLFKEVIHKENATFNILYFNDEPIAFVRFETDDTAPDQIYVGSFNVSKEAQGSPVASHFLHECMVEKNGQYDLVGEVYEARSLQFYLKLGWQQHGIVDNWHGTGLKFNKVIIPKGTLTRR